jgi:hypothetical protein
MGPLDSSRFCTIAALRSHLHVITSNTRPFKYAFFFLPELIPHQFLIFLESMEHAVLVRSTAFFAIAVHKWDTPRSCNYGGDCTNLWPSTLWAYQVLTYGAFVPPNEISNWLYGFARKFWWRISPGNLWTCFFSSYGLVIILSGIHNELLWHTQTQMHSISSSLGCVRCLVVGIHA